MTPELPATDSADTRRVAIVTPDLVGPIRNGGIGTAYTALAETLADAGHDVTVLYTLGSHCETGTIAAWIDDYRARGICLEPLPDPEGPQTLHGPGVSYAAYKWLAARSFDVVHFPDWTGLGFCAVTAKRVGLAFRETTLCVGVHGPTLWHDLGDGRYVDQPAQIERDHLERQSVALADVVVAPSRHILEWLRHWGWRLPEQTYVWPNVVPQVPVVGRTGRQPVDELVFFGRLEARKGAELFCDALDRLARSQMPEGFAVTLCGKPGRIRGVDAVAWLTERARRWPWPWKVLVDLDRASALDYLADGRRLAVIPSLDDNAPYTVAECLASGLPFLASHVGGIPEMVDPRDHAATLVLPNADALAAALASRVAHGAEPARAAVVNREVRQRWVNWHSTPPVVATPASGGRRPLVSVCMATHDRPAMLAQAVESLESQTYSPIEVILVDDGSTTEAAREALDLLEARFAARGWTLLRQPRAFPGAARNAAAGRARGEYLLFMDDDNVARPDEVAVFVSAAEHSGVPILTCAHDAFEGEDPPAAGNIAYRWIPVGGSVPLALFTNTVGDTNMLVARSAFFAAGGFDEEQGAGLYEDWAFFTRALARGLTIACVPESLYFYRVGAHGFGQRSPLHESYLRALGPFLERAPEGMGLALCFAAGAWRRAMEPEPARGQAAAPAEPPPPAVAPPRPAEAPSARPSLQHRLATALTGRLAPPAVGVAVGTHLAVRFDRLPHGLRVTRESAEGLSPMHQVRIAVIDDAVRLESLGDEPQVGIDCGSLALVDGAQLMLRIDLESPVVTTLQLFWKSRRLPLFCEAQSVTSPLAIGRNLVYVELPRSALPGRLRLDPSAVPGTFLLYSIEARAGAGQS